MNAIEIFFNTGSYSIFLTKILNYTSISIRFVTKYTYNNTPGQQTKLIANNNNNNLVNNSIE